MIELIAAAVTGAVVGGGVVALIARHQASEFIDALSASERKAFWAIADTLTALRSNCFIPDERGVKVRYSQASVERRVKVETPQS